jgi:hypothetical protein
VRVESEKKPAHLPLTMAVVFPPCGPLNRQTAGVDLAALLKSRSVMNLLRNNEQKLSVKILFAHVNTLFHKVKHAWFRYMLAPSTDA